ncbi:Perilipin-2 [Varanus komodoensis]|nr:Perilipin-2 [Varanus komodoensis]
MLPHPRQPDRLFGGGGGSANNSKDDLEQDWHVLHITDSESLPDIPQMTVEQLLLDRDLSMSNQLMAPPPSLEMMSASLFSIEKVLGETTASILTTAEAEASRYAGELKDLHLSPEMESELDDPHSVLSCRICQLFVRTVDRLLDKSEQLMDQYLPLTEEEIENLKKAVEELDIPSMDHQMQACLSRISDLSSKLRQRAYMMALSKLRLARRNTQESLSQLHQTIGLVSPQTLGPGSGGQTPCGHFSSTLP